jgi:GxxExxY protein
MCCSSTSRPWPRFAGSAYAECLNYELKKTDLLVEREKVIPLIYESIKLDCGYRADFMIDEKVIIEVKSVQSLNEVHWAQVITYLKLSNCKLGLLINFNAIRLVDGVRRVVNRI